MTECGAFDYCEGAARGFIRRGAARLGFLGERPVKASLLALADFVVSRSS